MIGVDSNIIMRLLINDDPKQSRRIEQLFAEHATSAQSIHIADVVLAEALWTFGSAYGADRTAQLKAVRALLDEATFTFESRDAVVTAARNFESSACGFLDCLIAARNAGAGCRFTATFDRKMSKLPAVQVI